VKAPCWLLFLVLAVIATTGRAAVDSGAAFAEANKLYEQGKFAEAAKSYDAIRASGLVSPALLFNLGNAWFKSGETGRAIATYQEAMRLTPRDPDLQANLRFARESAGTRTVEPLWRRWLRSFTLNEWVVGGAVFLWAWLGFLITSTLRPEWRSWLATWRRLALLGLVIATALTVAVLVDRFGHRVAVVIADEAVVRLGPLDDSQSHFTLRDGAEVEVLDHNGDWFQVRDVQQRIGWVKAQQVLIPDSSLADRHS